MDDSSSEDPCPSKQRPPPQCKHPHHITVERKYPRGCESRAEKKKPVSNEYPSSTACSKTVLEEEKNKTNVRPPPKPPHSRSTAPPSNPTVPPASKPIPVLPPFEPKCVCPSGSDKVQSAVARHQRVVTAISCAIRDVMCGTVSSTRQAIMTKIENNHYYQTIKKNTAGIYNVIPEKKEKPNCECPAVPKKVSDSKLNRPIVVLLDTSANKITDFIFKKGETAFSSIGGAIWQAMKPSSFNDQSSKYDVPKPKPK